MGGLQLRHSQVSARTHFVVQVRTGGGLGDDNEEEDDTIRPNKSNGCAADKTSGSVMEKVSKVC